MREALILGCGYTGRRVAWRLLARGVRVVAAARDDSALAPVAARGASAVAFDATRPASWSALAREAALLAPGYALLLSLPPLGGERQDVTAALLAALPRPGRVVYLSSTAVYGDRSDVDATSPAPPTPEHAARRAVERAVAAGPWSWLVLRAAAIYGPDRGLHVAAGSAPRRPGHPDRVVSRIHVDDLAVLCETALGSGVTGAFPAADLEPASAREVAAFCASIGLLPPALPECPSADQRAGRRVDGRAVFQALGVSPSYPSYREGIREAVLGRRARSPLEGEGG